MFEVTIIRTDQPILNRESCEKISGKNLFRKSLASVEVASDDYHKSWLGAE